jgi:16S rRNA processing protein RimM
MSYKNQILFGRIVRINGYDGTVTVKTEERFTENIPDLESVFIETNGKPVPFFISMAEYSGGDTLKLKFKDYESSEKISEFNGSRIFLTTALGEDSIPAVDNGVTGYKVFLRNNKQLGNVLEVIHNPGQDLIYVQSADKKEILIPLHSDFIVDIDEKSGIIIMDIPEGLTEIN